jgi:hypothetical protein
MPRLVGQQLAAQFQWILPTQRGQFVDAAVHGETRVRVPHRAPPQHRRRRLGVMRIHHQVGNAVHHVRRTFGAGLVESLALRNEAIRPAAAQHTLADDGLLPGHGITRGIHAAAQPRDHEWPVRHAAHIVFTSPGRQHGFANCLGHMHSVHDHF